ncbi:MAG: type I restriction endonuclease subunit R [Candidatus Nanoarchaeia archaeon]
MRHIMTEEDLERAALEMFAEQGYDVVNGLDIAPDGTKPERESYQDVVLVERLRAAINRVSDNKHLPDEAKERAIKQVLRSQSDKISMNNHVFHGMLVNGVDVDFRKDGKVVYDKVWLIDRKNIDKNEFLAVNQFTIIENNINRRPDIILFINGLPLVVIELKNPADQQTTIWSAFNQLETYKHQISSLFTYNEIMIISDGLEARAGTISSNKERFIAWKTIKGKKPSKPMSEIETLIKGMLNKETLVDLIINFILFEKDREHIVKILAAYHQYNAVIDAVDSTIKAIKTDHRAGIVWHTQGSGKSLTMVFYTGKIVLALDNPTVVVLTDRNDLDDQLFETFAKSHELLRQKPVHADKRAKLKELLSVSSGGVVFTTIQKFSPEENKDKYPLLSDRSNIIVIADEAHRTQYGFKAKVVTNEDEATIKYGFAKYVRDALPNASFIGFTGTPIETKDRSTPAVFGKCVSVYDIEQAVADDVTVRIYYESRLAKLELKPEERPYIDAEFEELTEAEEIDSKEKLKSKWARLEKVVGNDARIKKIAQDIVEHFEKRTEVLEGKGMIVCMSRRICIELYDAIIKLRPEWHNDDDEKGELKVIMTGSASDKTGWQKHIRNKPRRRAIGDRMKNPEDPLKLVIVRDMWLTGFDVPCLHTMYLDKPMQAHGLMQAIARVNRVFKNKKGGLIVDYIGVAHELKKALSNYTESGGQGKPTIDIAEAVALMLEKYEIVTDMYHGYDYKKFFKLSAKDKMSMMPDAIEFILKQKDGKDRYLRNVTTLMGAFSLAIPHPKAMAIKNDVGFFQAIRAAIAKNTTIKGGDSDQLDTAIRQILSKAIVSDRVVDIFAAAGLKKPNIAILSDEFLEDVKELPQKNLAFEMLKKILNDEIKIRMKKNLVQGKSFMEMLEKSIRAYTNKNIETAQVIQELIDLAKDMREANKRGEELNLTEDEVAFYDALGVSDSAVQVLGDKTLKAIAKELVETVRNNVSIDWTLRDNVKAKLKVMVKRVLKKYGYPPDKQQQAIETVLDQASIIAKDWAETTT